MRGKRQPLPAKQAKALAKAGTAKPTGSANVTSLPTNRPNVSTRSTRKSRRCPNRTYMWSDRQKARAGAIVSIDHDGKLDVMRGLIRPEDMKAEKPDDERSGTAARRSNTARRVSPPPCRGDLTAHRTAALRAVLADRPEWRLPPPCMHWPCRCSIPATTEAPSRIRATSAVPPRRRHRRQPRRESTAEQHAAWAAVCPKTKRRLWDWLLAQDAATVTALLAYCVACTVKPERGAPADRLAAAVALDMTQWWQPTVAGYLGRVPKTLILEAVTEGKGTAAADNIATLKKEEMADRAAGLLTGTGWLPALLRAA